QMPLIHRFAHLGFMRPQPHFVCVLASQHHGQRRSPRARADHRHLAHVCFSICGGILTNLSSFPVSRRRMLVWCFTMMSKAATVTSAMNVSDRSGPKNHAAAGNTATESTDPSETKRVIVATAMNTASDT